MQKLRWTSKLDTGIEVIDKQHKRIVDYINHLHDAHASQQSREEIAQVIEDLVDYTLTHFAFEESMLEGAKYPVLSEHKKKHEEFAQEVRDIQARFVQGDMSVPEELNNMIVAWLFNHILIEDADYVETVKSHAKTSGLFARLFK